MVWDCKKHNFNKYILAEIQHIFGFENKEIPASPKIPVLQFRNFVNFVKANTLEINQNALIGKIFPKYKKRNELLKMNKFILSKWKYIKCLDKRLCTYFHVDSTISSILLA